ncbi:mast cell protease 1A-like [Onychostoma macrolepis]|uniref:mast cell protease 1A-like n=1 Tax=Onychostoma macrolepis TaxID=369639 RepID=UPI00272A889F|nr:mast cell protease 1A-like [Onychostoma macrolepis]XP_058616172.1 mast cell protease 1A-like [Onychostoma macrolepis]
MVMGWGWKEYHHETPSNVLKEAIVTLIDSENCGVADTLCSEGSTGPTQGDSGGPLVCGGVAQGIISFSKNKRNADYLTGYTHISHYLSWIHHIMSPDMPKILDQVSTPGTLDPTPGRWIPKPDKQQVLSVSTYSSKAPHSRPYMVYIRGKVSKAACSGFLVREDYVMTAAHCKQSHLMVYLGVDDTNLLPDGVEVHPYPHPKFTTKRNGHDIMLLKLKAPATFNKSVKTITFPKTENEAISKDCMVMGWGWKEYHHESPSNVLKEANVTLIDSENCGVADTLCTEGSTGPTQGHSGGPLVCGGVAQGIVSFSKNKGNADYSQDTLIFPTTFHGFITSCHLTCQKY